MATVIGAYIGKVEYWQNNYQIILLVYDYSYIYIATIVVIENDVVREI